jgi:hypothetical protein
MPGGRCGTAVGPGGKTLASGSQGKTIKLWDLPAAKQAVK